MSREVTTTTDATPPKAQEAASGTPSAVNEALTLTHGDPSDNKDGESLNNTTTDCSKEKPNRKVWNGVTYPSVSARKKAQRQAQWVEKLPERRRKGKERLKARRKEIKQAYRNGEIDELPKPRGGHKLKTEQMQLMERKEALTLVIDCSYDDVMAPQEVVSMVTQLKFCYGHNNRADHPVKLVTTSLTDKTPVGQKLFTSTAGSDQWNWYRHEEPVEVVYKDRLDDVIYLSADADEVLDELSPDKVYVIGGLVDHNRLKGHCHQSAIRRGMKTAKLPLRMHMEGGTRSVLSLVHMTLIFIHRHTLGWTESFKKSLPTRWRWDTKDGSNTGEDEERKNLKQSKRGERNEDVDSDQSEEDAGSADEDEDEDDEEDVGGSGMLDEDNKAKTAESRKGDEEQGGQDKGKGNHDGDVEVPGLRKKSEADVLDGQVAKRQRTE